MGKVILTPASLGTEKWRRWKQIYRNYQKYVFFEEKDLGQKNQICCLTQAPYRDLA